ncbi:MAG: hypothetical protein H8E57_02385 [Candidatus Cloacimonetes bacterium]|nr:hypothetical protein [Candidatus Cloacimonadota bacterium]
MFSNRNLLFFIIIIFFFSGCAVIGENQRKVEITGLNVFVTLSLDFTPRKACYSSENKTVFVFEDNSNIIHLFRDGKEINKIGNLGFEKNNFSKLSDITISPDGNLLALDSFQKKIKKFDQDGKWITEFELTNLSEPTLLDIAFDETFYIFDNDLKEILITREFEQNRNYTFGKFQFSDPTYISIQKDHISIFDGGKTFVYNSLGQLENELNGNIQFFFNNKIELDKYFLKIEHSDQKFAVSTNEWNSFLIKGNYCILFSDKEIRIAEFVYERR